MKNRGFTIVELLIVIVVIAILAAVSVVAYNGIQARANLSKSNTDLSLLARAIQAARVNNKESSLYAITGSDGTGIGCRNKPSGTDFATLDKSTDSCWTIYTQTLQRITNASNINVTGLEDPWGRPYLIDENEGVGSPCGSGRDVIGVWTRPYNYSWVASPQRIIPYVNSDC